MNARYRVELLGGLRLVQEERVITRFRTHKFGALLGYLAYHLQQVHSREVLIELLWPDCQPSVGRQRLSLALSSLRRQLEPPGIPFGGVLQADRFNVGLNPQAMTTDVAEFEAALRFVAQSGGNGERLTSLQQAVELYQGVLLPGYYEEWVLLEQQRLAEQHLQALQQLTWRRRGS
jgi:DNA-binding SARP family transcriptional activator